MFIHMSALSIYSFNNEQNFATARVGYKVRWVAVFELHLNPVKAVSASPQKSCNTKFHDRRRRKKSKVCRQDFWGFQIVETRGNQYPGLRNQLDEGAQQARAKNGLYDRCYAGIDRS